MDQLFVSRVRIKLLKFFLTRSNEEIHLRGAVRELKEEINAIRRELIRLETINLIESESRGNRKYYRLNKNGPFIDELRGMVYKTFGLGGELLRNFNKLGEVHTLILTGNYVAIDKDSNYPVDLVVIGSPDQTLLSEIIKKQEEKEKVEINYTILSASDFVLRKKRKDNFLMDLLIAPKVMLYGNQEDLLV
jgi:DNA-binding transcriptional ArsR family regulator